MTYSKIVEILLTAVILYFGFPLFAAATVFCALYYCGGGWGTAKRYLTFSLISCTLGDGRKGRRNQL